METKELKKGDFVRLTDPIDNGKIVRVEMVENGWIEFIGGGQSCYEQVKGSIKLCGVEHFWTLSEFIRLLEQGFGVKLYPESAVEYWKNRAEVEEKEHSYYEQAWGKEHSKLLNAQDELATYKDKTYLSDDFFVRNGFEKRIITNGKPTLPPPTFLYCDDVEEISAQCIDAEMGVWRVYVGFLESGNGDTLDICTVGQLRMFLVIEGLDELAKQFK